MGRWALLDTFLTAEWRHLLMLNYEVPAEMLARHVPRGVALDLYEGRALVSLVGFRFQRTRVLGRVAVPFHTDFDELNLRFYVKREVAGEGTRRGVCFIREFVPRWAIAFVARQVYEEPYLAVPMRHELALDGATQRVCYGVKVGGAWHTMEGRPGRRAGAGDGRRRNQLHHRALLGLHTAQHRQHVRVPGGAPNMARAQRVVDAAVRGRPRRGLRRGMVRGAVRPAAFLRSSRMAPRWR